MTGDEALLIARLFERLGAIPGLSHDPEAMRFAAAKAAAIADHPGVTAQLLLAQEAAIVSLRNRLSELERERAAAAAWQVGAARYLTLQVAETPHMPAPDGSFLQGVFAAAAAFASGRLLMDAEPAAPPPPDARGGFSWGGGAARQDVSKEDRPKEDWPEEDWYAIRGAPPPDDPAGRG